ncbi:NAD-dependent epimerase/dehydratase family protein [Nocardia sp. NPDC049526]|uniref:NAD-dependent epimerase/dehydratase family protein n=1 Tax=Nocardia sp. NPDC049526 TaxID=3364316 RepID=UPI00378C9BE6
MKIAVVGATGMVGSRVVDEAASRGHELVAVFRKQRPALLEPGHRTGKYRRGTTTLITAADGASRISAEDLAVAVLDELETPCETQHFTVGY